MDYSAETITMLVFIYGTIGIFTTLAHLFEIEGENAASVAAGVLWPFYLPYRLVLLIWRLKP